MNLNLHEKQHFSLKHQNQEKKEEKFKKPKQVFTNFLDKNDVMSVFGPISE